MTEKVTVTQHEVLSHLRQTVGRLPEESREFIHESLLRVSRILHPDVAAQPFDSRWEEALRTRLCELAHVHLASVIKSNAVDDVLQGKLRGNLDILARTKMPTKESDDPQAHDQA